MNINYGNRSPVCFQEEDQNTLSAALSKKNSDTCQPNESIDKQESLSLSSHQDKALKEPKKEIEKPQSKFIPQVDNSDSPFKPGIKNKPNAISTIAYLLDNRQGWG